MVERRAAPSRHSGGNGAQHQCALELRRPHGEAGGHRGASLFSDLEFGYLVGDLASVVSDYLANVWYGEYDEATIASAAQQLEEQAKTMKQPFQRPKAGIGVAMDASGITLNFTGVAADGVSEVSTSVKLTWTQVLEAQ